MRQPIRQAAGPQRLRGLARDICTRDKADIEGDPLQFLKVSEAFWRETQKQYTMDNAALSKLKTPAVVREHLDRTMSSSAATTSTPSHASPSTPDYDVTVCGGTLGIFVALALQQRGHRVAVIERRRVEGRTQEWNISRHELYSLVEVGLLTKEEADSCITSEFNPIR